jgi:hypothetical protein
VRLPGDAASARRALNVALVVAAVLALLVLLLPGGGSPGIEIERRDPPFGVPHHGSRSSSTPELVAAVRPTLAVVSPGAGNLHGHPHDEALARYAGALLARTDEHGDVKLTSDGERLWARAARGDLGGAP